MKPYRDRRAAGEDLAGHLSHLKGSEPLVLGIPRGGVETAAPVASALGARLGVVHAAKVGAPGNPELAIGAVTADGHALIDEVMARRIRATPAEVDAAVAAAVGELRRREDAFGVTPEVRERTVVIVDDGVATGATLRAACDYVRRQGAATVVCAIPVGPQATVDRLADHADSVVCVGTPEPFAAVGEWYQDFSQTTDERVLGLLDS